MAQETICIYRFERFKAGEKCGIYGSFSWQTREHSPENGCPGPEDDKKLTRYLNKLYKELNLSSKYSALQKFHFGFDSEEQLFNWFSDLEEIRRIYEYGGFLSIYYANKVFSFSSDYQTIFIKPKDAECISLETLEEFLEFFTN